ncbi:Crp/Fnr family transcriptional regulator [Belliella sp. DSM 111904]|uniref:Crp/Fnr family transcriptional regulator n=1 Tax=Belliella filtrata TaxID=2923435 RepID=A0ABS9V1E2_9BACT|nr:Crp/Fnr family transcriptional regulator [Belliella filtrata]MCH7410236.1 Crp/Fnr family transcriptional regulator [Belliella filtrata]
MDIDEILDSVSLIHEDPKAILKSYTKEVNFPKGHLLLHAQKCEKSIYFIKKGIVRAYSNTAENEVTFWFGKEGDAVISMKSYIANQPGYENIELLENSCFYEMNNTELQKLYNEHIEIANWGRKFAENELLKTEERLISRQFRTASERYDELLKNHPHLVQRVQLSHIASYLGITQVSLSRIRAAKN